MNSSISSHVTKYTLQARANICALRYDRDYKTRLVVLQKLVKAFTEANVKWAVSCSLALFLMGIVDNFHDFDLLVAPESFADLCQALDKIGTRKKFDKDPSRTGCFRSKDFAEYEVDGIDIDVICEFGFTTFGSVYQYHFDENDLKIIAVANLSIPVIAAEAQYVFYAMMVGWQSQRAFKRDLITDYLKSGNMKQPEFLERILREEHMPSNIVEGIAELLGE